jgi:amino acid adenylation domain-containing protein/thioester reductase-like protein
MSSSFPSMTFQLDSELPGRPGSLMKREYTSLSTLAAMWAVLLSRYMDEEEIELRFSTRELPENLQGKEGGTQDWHSFKVAIDQTLSFSTFIRSITAKLGETGVEHGNCPSFSVAIRERDHTFPGMAHSASFSDIVLTFREQEPRSFSLTWPGELFGEWLIEQMGSHLIVIMSHFLENPSGEVHAFPLVTDREREDILVEWNRTEAPFPENETLYHLFEEQVERTPNITSVVCGGELLTYRELNERANHLAQAIRAHYRTLHGEEILPDIPIGICMNRGVGMIVAMMGILKAGCAYVPLDPTYPTDRLRYMLDDARAPIVVTERMLLEKLLFLNETDYGVISLDSGWDFIARFPGKNPPPISGPGNLAYCIYTSGSTGRPKGVLISHRNAVNFIFNEIRSRAIKAGDHVLEFASINFDAAVADIYITLLSGATLHIAHDEIRREPEELFRYLKDNAITGTALTPAVLHGMPKEELPSLKALVVAGDVCSSEDMLFWSRGRVLINGYGPTECTVGTTETVFDEKCLHNEIGHPIANAKVYVLDHLMQPVPPGVPGELHIGGEGVGKGYLNNKKLTDERFVPNPFVTAEEKKRGKNLRLYKSGDRVRWLKSGSLEFLGRVDFQVKIRGFRIEPGEIEAVLSSHGVIKECAVVPYDDGLEKKLAAYFVALPGSSPSIGDLRTHLREQLPDYMIPSVFVSMEHLPLSPSGKINRHALPLPDESNILRDESVSRDYVEPRDAQEMEISRIITGVMNMERISITSDFFDLGAHSLTASQIASELRKKFSTRIGSRDIFEQPTIEKLSHFISRTAPKGREEALSIPRAASRHYIPLTFQQEQIWFLSKLVLSNRAYNAQAAIRFKGPLDREIFTAAINQIIRRHEILRTTFRESEHGPVQVVHAPWKAHIPVKDLRGLPEAERSAEVDRLIDEEMSKAFDYTRLPLVKWVFYRIAEDEHILLHMEHHFVHDGWEVSVFFNELKALYTAFKEGEKSPLDHLPLQYADYAIWQRNYLSGACLEEKINYWVNRIRDYPQIVNLPVDHPRPSVQSFNGGLIRLDVKDLYQRLREFSRIHKVTLFNTMFSAFAVLISKYSRQPQFLIGTGVANRTLKEMEQQLGMFVNTVLLHPDLSENPSFKELLRATKEDMLADSEHYDTPFMHIVERLKAGHTPGRNPIFQILFAFHDSAVPYLDFEGVHGEFIIKHNATAKTDINVICIPRAEQHTTYKGGDLSQEDISILWEYNTDLFERHTMEGMLEHYMALLEEILVHPEKRVMDIDMLVPRERERLLYRNNSGTATYDREKTIPELFVEQARKNPLKTAVICGDQQITYQELNVKANALAEKVRKHFRESGGGEMPPSTPVGICVERSIDMLVGILGILKAGGAYVPLPANYPESRLRFIVDDADMKVIVTQKKFVGTLPFLGEEGRAVMLLDEERTETWSGDEPALYSGADDCAYIIYTSGSTGNPKGVSIPHRAVNNFLVTMKKEALTEHDVVAQCASYAFDASIFEFWGSLLVGGTLVIMDSSKVENLDLLKKEMEEKKVTSALFTTALFNAIVDCNREILTRMSSVFFGGEAVNAGCVKRLLQGKPDALKVFHLYGPTECTCCCTYCHLTEEYHDRDVIPIGKPLFNYRAYVLDEKRNPVPTGVPGELFIGGESLALGYLNRPELTRERFIDNPFASDDERRQGRNTRLYKTGDLVRWNDEGNIVFLGRTDFQVKIRGFRIEPEEIESALLKHKAVKQCAVIPWEQHLIAYWVPVEPTAELSKDEFKAFLAGSLPAFMIPATFIKMESFTLNQNFKVDRSRLPHPKLEDIVSLRKEYTPPATKTEEKLVEIWKELLKLEKISTDDSFFDLGGNSILTVRMLSAIKRSLGADVKLAQMFTNPTIKAIGACLDGTGMTTGAVEDNLSRALHDATWELDAAIPKSGGTEVPSSVLLTGAPGFVGMYLLDELLALTEAQVYCLLRGDDEEAIRARFVEAARFYRKEHLLGNKRIRLMKVDMEAERYGLGDEPISMLCETIDSIFHCGAIVHHLYDYGKLRKANVQSVMDLLKIAASGKRKSFTYISTLGVASIRDMEGKTVEVDVSERPVSTNGYTLSKWVAEKILARAAAKGLDVAIFRLGNVVGDSVHGICAPDKNHALLRIKGCLQMKAAPDWLRTTEMTPVDVLARSIVKLSLVSKGLNIYNMNNPLEISWRDYIGCFRKYGFDLDLVPESLWREKYLAAVDEKNALFAIKDFYSKDRKEAATVEWKPFSRWNSHEVRAKLEELGVRYPEDYDRCITTDVDYLIGSGFLSSIPHHENKEVAYV